MSQRSLWSYYVKRKKAASSAVSGLGTQEQECATQSSHAAQTNFASTGNCSKPSGGGKGEVDCRDEAGDSWRDASPQESQLGSSCLAGNKRLRGGEARHEETPGSSKVRRTGSFSCEGVIHERAPVAESTGTPCDRASFQGGAQADPNSWKKRFLAALGSGDVASKAGSDESWADARGKYAWLAPENIRDAQKRRPGSPDFDKRTVFVPDDIWGEQHTLLSLID